MIMNGRGGGGIRFPFTPSQWQELEQQALIFKYMLSGVPIPPHLLFTLSTRSSITSSLRDIAHPMLPSSSSSSVGWRCFEMGRKIDPEPGRCRRTDGKKWRCSKEAVQDSKYCEKHMHRGKNRSRKHVEQRQHTSSSLTTAAAATSSSQTTSDKHHPHHPPAYSKLDSTTTTTDLALDYASSYHSRYYRNRIHGWTSMEDDDSWRLAPLAMSSINSKKTTHHPYLDSSRGYSKLAQGQLHDIMCDVNESTRRDDLLTVYRFLEEEPPEKKDYSSTWLNLDDKSSTTTTQLSISIPAATSNHHVFPILNNSSLQSKT